MSQSLSPALKTASVLGLPIHLSNNYLAWLTARLQRHQGVHVVTLNAEMAMQAEQNAALAQVIQKADLVVPDGSGVVLYLRLRGKKTQRCPGIELAEALLRQSARLEQSYRVFLYGGAPGVTQTATQRLQQQIPGIEIVGTQHGYLSQAEQTELQHKLADLGPDIILVGLGVPRQEFWITEHRHLCPHAIWMGIGGSFDIWAGTKTRAPSWLRDNHLEWVYRLYQEPWRWRRMLALPRFVWRTIVSPLHHG